MSKELIESIGSGKLDAVKLVLESVQGEDELHKLLSTKNDQYRRTVLGMAAAAGHLDIVKYLVEKGARVDATSGAGVGALVGTFVEKVLESQRLGQSVNAKAS